VFRDELMFSRRRRDYQPRAVSKIAILVSTSAAEYPRSNPIRNVSEGAFLTADFFRRTIGTVDDLFSGIVQRVECVENFLNGLFFRDELSSSIKRSRHCDSACETPVAYPA
jgi:hypothetical protein